MKIRKIRPSRLMDLADTVNVNVVDKVIIKTKPNEDLHVQGDTEVEIDVVFYSEKYGYTSSYTLFILKSGLAIAVERFKKSIEVEIENNIKG